MLTYPLVRWSEVLHVDLDKARHRQRDARRADEFLDFLERSGRVVARVGNKVILRAEPVGEGTPGSAGFIHHD